ncbi:MAG: hypothetical protein KF746_12840 [Chitinophagaceae bacterium]|nr:hypothetical protein [Chitinophagaceae bacterium]
MKRIAFLNILFAVLFFAACRKNDNPKIPELERVPVPSLTVKDGSDAQISPTDPAGFSAQIDVDLFFKDDIPPQKFDLVVIKNKDKSTVEVIQAGITSFPTTVSITGQELIDLYGEIEDGDVFTVGVDITTQNGSVFQAFPPVGAGYGPGVQNEAGGVTLTVDFARPCAYVPSLYEGDFEVVVDEFLDTAPGDVLTLTKIDDTHFSYVYPSPTNPLPIIVEVDPGTNRIKIVKQKIGDNFSWEPAYTNPHAETTSSAENQVLPCAESFTLIIAYSVDQGDFGSYKFTMKKK